MKNCHQDKINPFGEDNEVLDDEEGDLEEQFGTEEETY